MLFTNTDDPHELNQELKVRTRTLLFFSFLHYYEIDCLVFSVISPKRSSNCSLLRNAAKYFQNFFQSFFLYFVEKSTSES